MNEQAQLERTHAMLKIIDLEQLDDVSRAQVYELTQRFLAQLREWAGPQHMPPRHALGAMLLVVADLELKVRTLMRDPQNTPVPGWLRGIADYLETDAKIAAGSIHEAGHG